MTILTFAIILLLHQTNKVLFAAYISLLSFTTIVIYLIQETYGPVDFTFCLSTYYTNIKEAGSYVNSVKLVYLAVVTLYILATVSTVVLSNINKVQLKRSSFVAALFAAIVLHSTLTVRLIKANKPTFSPLENYSYMFFSPLLKVSANLYHNIYNVKLYMSTQDKMLSNFSQHNNFKFKDSLLDKEIYVVVIGESVSKAYMSAYNPEIKSNTPFIDSSSNLKFKHFVAPACNTINSLMTVFTFNNNRSSIISLLKGVQNNNVAWISSQAQVGKHENPVSAIGMQADTTVFGSTNLDVSSDFEAVKSVLKLRKRYKTVFIHIFGSHPNPCDRVRRLGSNSDLDCYLETISELDKQLNYIHHYLQSNFKSYKLLYFSDHGIVYNDGKIVHGASKSAYEVPLILWSDDMLSKRTINSHRTGNDFAKLWEEFFDIDIAEINSDYLFVSDDPYPQRIFVLDNYKKKIWYESLK